jgi:hypothetical protein
MVFGAYFCAIENTPQMSHVLPRYNFTTSETPTGTNFLGSKAQGDLHLGKESWCYDFY